MFIELVAGLALAAVLFLVFLLRRYARLPAWPLLVLVVALLLGLIRLWSWGGTANDLENLVRVVGEPPSGNSDTLIVLVHGIGGPADLAEVKNDLAALRPRDWSLLDPQPAEAAPLLSAHLLLVDYGKPFWMLTSNDEAPYVARGVSRQIQKAVEGHSYKRIVVVGYSMGALIARGAFLLASGKPLGACAAEPASWADKVCRFVLLAGMNRGFDFSGRKPSDMSSVKYAIFRTCANAARWTDTGALSLATETGSPFVAGVRLQWMNLARERGDAMPGTVQLLGDIDDFVSDADNKDLRVAGASRFAWLRVRGTGHPEIVELGRCAADGSEEKRLGQYRACKIRQALTRPFAELRGASEEQPFQVDPDVKRVVFVVHGIRDLGQWSSGFEKSLLAEFRHRQPAALAAAVGLAAVPPTPGLAAGSLVAGKDGPFAKLVIASPRYGYLYLAPFLLPPVRQKYVRWFMDEYTETLARYPAAEVIDAIGHSNGTYLLASALERYPALKMDRIVLGNSVVRQAYRWDERMPTQVQAVRNYVTSNDWVVALFPRFFQEPPGSWLQNDLGSAGFTGFCQGTDQGVTNTATVRGGHSDHREADHDVAQRVTNVATVRGGHSSLHTDVLERRRDIVAFLLEGSSATSEPLHERVAWLDGLSAGCLVVWALLAYLVVLVGYGALLVSAACGLRLTGRPWTWLATGSGWRSAWWSVGALRLLGALACLLLVVAFFFTARESLLFVLVVALLAGRTLRVLFPATFGPNVGPPPGVQLLEVVPGVLAVGLGVSFVAGGLSGLTELGWLLLAALVVVPVAVVLGRVVAAVLPAPPRAGRVGVGLGLTVLLAVVLFGGLLLVGGWQQLALLMVVFGLGVLLVKLAWGPLADANNKYPALPTAPIAGGSGIELCNAAGLLLAPAYFAIVVYILLSF